MTFPTFRHGNRNQDLKTGTDMSGRTVRVGARRQLRSARTRLRTTDGARISRPRTLGVWPVRAGNSGAFRKVHSREAEAPELGQTSGRANAVGLQVDVKTWAALGRVPMKARTPLATLTVVAFCLSCTG